MQINKYPIISLPLFSHHLSQSTTLTQLNQCLQNYLYGHGISFFSFTYYFYFTNSPHELKYDFASPKYKRWHDHYVAENYQEIDSTLTAVTHSILPQFWVVKNQLKNATSAKEIKMRQDSLEFGAEKGLCIPLHGPQGNFANFVVAQMQGENFLDNCEDLQFELFSAAHYYFAHVHQLLIKNQPADAKYQLNKREMQCLNLIAEQLPLSLMATRLNLTERTINHYIQKLNKKLGCKNKYQSLAKAIYLGLVKP